ncbi:hypothetical protein BZA77DRAFT_324201 [Pyronema omphalodes]|nr:hypothetical protein BZA77DRAFT_324201 [Pyronema omphalodes]
MGSAPSRDSRLDLSSSGQQGQQSQQLREVDENELLASTTTTAANTTAANTTTDATNLEEKQQEKKKKKKKKISIYWKLGNKLRMRNYSLLRIFQFQETAEALVNLRSEAGVVQDETNDQEQVDVDEPKKKKKKRSKKHREVDESVAMEVDEHLVPSPMETANHDVDTSVIADPTVTALTDALSNVPDVQLQLPTGNNNIPQATPIDQSGLQHMVIPDQQIITEHLAAHMANTTSEQQPSEDMLEQRIMTELAMAGSDGFVAVNQNNEVDPAVGNAAASNKSAKKRKRTDIPLPMNELVDPQLMQLDEQAALVTATDFNDPNNKAKKRRRPGPLSDAIITQDVLEDDSIETAESAARRAYKRKTANPGEGKISWGATPSVSSPAMVNGGTFSLEERHTIDLALNEYCRVHNMSMEELKDRVWGNTRKKDEFWDTICNAVPNRSRASVYKHFDAELASLVAEKGNKWKDIGDALGRMGEDCRDRYRNYVKCGDNRGTDRWSEEEEALLRNTVMQHKEETKQIFLQEGKDLPSPEEEDAVLINWTCRYKWKKMLAQKEKVKAAPLGVTYVGGKKKRLTYDISAMLPGDRQWLLTQIRDSHATQENEIPWDMIAKYDKEVGIWTHKDLKNAYKKFREHIPHKRRPLNEIIKQLLQELESEYTPEIRKQRFIPNPDAVNISSQQSPPAVTSFEQQMFQMVTSGNPSGVDTGAPVAPMVPGVMVDPSLMEQGMVELQKMAGEALCAHAHSNGLRAQEAEDENDRELGKRLRGFIDENLALTPEA